MQKAFTLIEVVVYGVLMMAVVSLVVSSVSQLIDGTSLLIAQIAQEEEANFILRKITWALTGVSTVNAPAAGATDTWFSVNKFNFAQNPIVIDSTTTSIRIGRLGGNPVALNSQAVPVSNVQFTHYPATGGEPAALEARFSINMRSYQTKVYLPK